MFESLRKKYPEFIYESYELIEDDEKFQVNYVYRLNEFVFKPFITISKRDINNKNIDLEFLKYLFFNFGMVDLINYYKLTCSSKIIIKCGSLTEEQLVFFKKIMYNGLKEYCYINNISLTFEEFVTFQISNKSKKEFDISNTFKGNLIPIGGGKDSAVTLDLLKNYRKNNTCFVYNRNIYPISKASLDTIYCGGYNLNDLVSFNNNFDLAMIDLSKTFLNGHIPLSSQLAFAAYIMAYLNNKEYVVLSNESSANDFYVKGTDINHQYSKSFEFEEDFRKYTEKFLTKDIKYFSLLRPWNEYQIVKYFVKTSGYIDVFRSCNLGSKNNTWCSNCAKCLYIYIMLSPFVNLKKLDKIFDKRMFEDKSLINIFNGLVSSNFNKPFECIGEREEINYALKLTLQKYQKLPYLLRYYKDNFYNENIKYNLENYFNNNHFIPNIYLKLVQKNEK